MDNTQSLSKLGLDDKLKDIWANYHGLTNSAISPVYQKEVRKNVVTFLSLNPSLPPSERANPTRGNRVHTPFNMIDFEKPSPNPFYKKYYDIHEKIDEPWTAIDLLYIRDSKQNQIEQLYKSDAGKIFILNQVEITLEILKAIKPKLVIVANAFVDKVLHENYNGRFEMNGDNIYRFDGIPFIIRESRFMGSPRLWISKKEIDQKRKETMYGEIKCVLNSLNSTAKS